ncbi:hypothetical protein ACIQLJ_03755 [Microbacterium sp. NPDC091313]
MRDLQGAAQNLEALVNALPAGPAFAFDPHLDVVAANALAGRFLRVRVGENLASLTFLDGRVDRSTAAWQACADVVAGLLRASLAAHAEDDRFLEMVGELATTSAEFPSTWARWPDSTTQGSLTCSAAGQPVTLRFAHLLPSAAPWCTLVMTWAADDRASAVLAAHSA